MHKFIFPQAPVKWFCLFYLNWIHTIIFFIVFQNLHLNKTCIERMIICGSWFGRSFLLVNFFFVSCWFVANTTKCILRFHTLDHLYQSSWMNIYIHLFLIISLTSTWFFGPLKAEKLIVLLIVKYAFYLQLTFHAKKISLIALSI